MLRFISAFILLVFSISVYPCQAESPKSAFLNNGVTAHRGNSGETPENTLDAFRSAIEAGADWIELDIFRTKDGVLVVTHDANMQRVSGQNLVVAESTLEELRRLDVATQFRAAHKLTPQQCPPRQIPTLKEVLQLVIQQSKTRASLQQKMDCVADAVKLIHEMKAEPWIGFNDGNLAYMSEAKRLAPKVTIFWDRPANCDLDKDLPIALENQFDALVLNVQGVTPEKVARIQAAGLEAGAWTVNDPATMQKLLAMGIDRIYTDYPSTLLKLVEQQAGNN